MERNGRDEPKIGIQSGKPPIHNREVALVLDCGTGCVSPKLHVKVDPGLYTLRQESLPSNWQRAKGFEQTSLASKNQLSKKRMMDQLPKKWRLDLSVNSEGELPKKRRLDLRINSKGGIECNTLSTKGGIE